MQVTYTIRLVLKLLNSSLNNLFKVSMEIMNDTRCKQKYSQMFNIEKQICAGETNGNSGACQGLSFC